LAPNSLEFDVTENEETVEFRAALGDIEWWEAEVGEGAQYYVSLTCLDPSEPDNFIFIWSTYLSTSSSVFIDGESIPVESQVNQDGDYYSLQASFVLPQGITQKIFSCSSLQGWFLPEELEFPTVGGSDFPIRIYSE
jgi:hypothetical protein